MSKAIIVSTTGEHTPIAAVGMSMVIREWRGSGPDYMHVHHADDEAWHVLEGTLTFRLADGDVEASAGSTVFVPAGVAHTYSASDDARYLMILTPKLDALIARLHQTPYAEHGKVLLEFDSEIVTPS